MGEGSSWSQRLTKGIMELESHPIAASQPQGSSSGLPANGWWLFSEGDGDLRDRSASWSLATAGFRLDRDARGGGRFCCPFLDGVLLSLETKWIYGKQVVTNGLWRLSGDLRGGRS